MSRNIAKLREQSNKMKPQNCSSRCGYERYQDKIFSKVPVRRKKLQIFSTLSLDY